MQPATSCVGAVNKVSATVKGFFRQTVKEQECVKGFSPAELLSCLGAGDSAFALRFTCKKREAGVESSHCSHKTTLLPACGAASIQGKGK